MRKIRLETNFVHQIDALHSIIPNSGYEESILKKLKWFHPYSYFDDEGFSIVYNFIYKFNKILLGVTLWDKEEKKITDNIADNNMCRLIYDDINALIEKINNEEITFINFESMTQDESFYIHGDKIYGAIYDLSKQDYVYPAKVKETKLVIQPIEYEQVIEMLARGDTE